MQISGIYCAGVEIALIRLSGLSKNYPDKSIVRPRLSAGQVAKNNLALYLYTIFITKQKSLCHKTLLFMACPIVPKYSFSETKRSTRLLLNSSDVYKSPAEQVGSSMAPSDHIRTITNLLAFIPTPRQTTREYRLPIGRH